MTPIEIWNNLWNCLVDEKTGRFSIKKVMAAVTHLSMIFLSFKHCTTDNVLIIITYWGAFILILMGINSYDKKTQSGTLSIKDSKGNEITEEKK